MAEQCSVFSARAMLAEDCRYVLDREAATARPTSIVSHCPRLACFLGEERAQVQAMHSLLLLGEQSYSQCPERQTHASPRWVHCPGTQVAIRSGGFSNRPWTQTHSLLFQFQYPGTQTWPWEGGGIGISSRGGGGGCRTITSGGGGPSLMIIASWVAIVCAATPPTGSVAVTIM